MKAYRLEPTEHEVQCAFIERVRLFEHSYPALKLLIAVPNGGLRHPRTAARLKAEGVRAGVPDILWPYACGKYHGLALEFKRTQGDHLRPEQRAYLSLLGMFGWRWERVWDHERAWEIVLDYLSGEKATTIGEKAVLRAIIEELRQGYRL